MCSRAPDSASSLFSADEDPPTDSSGVQIEAIVSSSVTYASQQNSIPILRRLKIHHHGDEVLTDVELKLTSLPGFLRTKVWRFDELPPGQSLVIDDRDLQLDVEYLAGLDEAESGYLRFQLTSKDKHISESETDLRVLAKNEWGGTSSMGELLPAFVMPNDPAVSMLLRNASERLRKEGLSSALDGYQAKDRQRVEMQISAIWAAICDQEITYTNPPKSFERNGQKIRLPGVVLSEKLATCLDLSLLFAAALEAIGLNPVVILARDHSLVGAWADEMSFGRLIESDCTEVRKSADEQNLLLFETTLLTHRPSTSFRDSHLAAKKWIRQITQADFVAAIDISRARMVRILPMASHGVPRQSTPDHGGEPNAQLSISPLSVGTTARPPVDPKPTTPDGRIDRWHRKLLDLTLRNRLLNFRSTKKTIPLLCPELGDLEDRLSRGKKLKIISLPDANVAAGRDIQLHEQVSLQDIETQFARSAFEKSELCATLNGDELKKRLTNLYRSSRNDLAEGGSNTLYLAVGFLRWKEQPRDKRSFRAPLLLIPASLIRKNAGAAYQLVHYDDEVRFNATLIQKLKRDFQCDLSALENDLPRDDLGVDVPAILQTVRAAIRELRGFEVVDESALASFSFAKYLMWKDLVDRSEYLEQNRVVRHLVRDPDSPFQSAANSPMPLPKEIDRRYSPADLVHPLDADSSQLAAVMAAAEGHDFVLVGPPGTGKSQTIANMIAQCLASGKTVLFVAEKTAALDVVQRRLEHNGLGDFCVELHSNKAERKRFLMQLDQCWRQGRRKRGKNWSRINRQLGDSRDTLNSYVDALHEKAANGWTAYQAIGTTASNESLVAPKLEWPHGTVHDDITYQQMDRVVHQLEVAFAAIEDTPQLSAVSATQWSLQWEQKLIELLPGHTREINALRDAFCELCVSLGLQQQDGSEACIGKLRDLAVELLDTAEEDFQSVFDEELPQLPKALSNLDQAITRFDSAAGECGATFDDSSIRSIPIDARVAEWEQASKKYWPFSSLGRRAIRNQLQDQVEIGQVALPADFQSIRRMQTALREIDKNPLASRSHLWDHRKTATSRLANHLERCQRIRCLIDELIPTLGNPEMCGPALIENLKAVLTKTEPSTPTLKAAKRFILQHAAYESSTLEFARCAGSKPHLDQSQFVFEHSIEMLQRIEKHRKKLQAWTHWQAIRSRGQNLGLDPICEMVLNGELAPGNLSNVFRVAYARWWAPVQIDRHPALRDFQRHQHEDMIREFCDSDHKARQAASHQVRKSVAHRLPAQSDVPRKSELGLLRHQIGLKRPSKSIRELIEMMPEHFAELSPCLLMSPLSIAQYLPADQPPFDVVIFDEASQITTWDAIGAIARGRQTIIVGDPKQLPPTNFFGKSNDDEEFEDLEDYERDLESILDEAVASGLPTLQLNWHYRSRHESLIAFSNRHYYNDELVTFPSPETTDSAVQLKYLPNASYDRGKTRTNQIEANAIVEDAVLRMKEWLSEPEEQRKTIGVVTFNSQQQSLILDLFDKALQDNPELEWYFSDDRVEPTVVKNLENVQGDERDVMLFSVTFGPDQSGKVPLTFGALNQDGGERRLNVAVTRAREQLIAYTSFLPDQLEAERSKSRGLRDLKRFLEYAHQGHLASETSTQNDIEPDTSAAHQSSLEDEISRRLKLNGWDVQRNVGVSGFRIALAVRHPSDPERFLAGIECDGLVYRDAATARDRDITRELVLTNLGWRILRVWSRQWWYDPDGAFETLNTELRRLLDG